MTLVGNADRATVSCAARPAPERGKLHLSKDQLAEFDSIVQPQGGPYRERHGQLALRGLQRTMLSRLPARLNKHGSRKEQSPAKREPGLQNSKPFNLNTIPDKASPFRDKREGCPLARPASLGLNPRVQSERIDLLYRDRLPGFRLLLARLELWNARMMGDSEDQRHGCWRTGSYRARGSVSGTPSCRR